MTRLLLIFTILFFSAGTIAQKEKNNDDTIHVSPYGKKDDHFSPNGHNDFYQPDLDPALEIATFKFCIYDDDGECIFQTTDLSEGWDGTRDGHLVDDGTYIWSVTYTEFGTIKKRTVKGNVIVEK